MSLLTWIRRKLDRELTRAQLIEKFLQGAAHLAKKGKVVVLNGSVPVLARALTNDEDEIFIIVFKGTRLYKPKELEEWFRNYK